MTEPSWVLVPRTPSAENVMDAFETVGIRPGPYYSKARLLQAGRIIAAMSAPPPPGDWERAFSEWFVMFSPATPETYEAIDTLKAAFLAGYASRTSGGK